ncbi:hypothetical protein PS2_025674 [Malus domestica]
MGKEDPNAGKVAILNVFGLVYDMVAVFSIEYAGELAAALAASKLHPLQNETDARVSQGFQAGFGAGRQGAVCSLQFQGNQDQPVAWVHNHHHLEEGGMICSDTLLTI